MRLLVSGSNGMVGSALLPRLDAAHHTVRRLVRAGGVAGDATWRPDRGELDASALDGIDAVVHLAGTNRPAVGVNPALYVDVAEHFQAIGRAECEGAAEVRNVGERFLAIEVDAISAGGPAALRQDLASRHEPQAGIAVYSRRGGARRRVGRRLCVLAGLRLCPRWGRQHGAERRARDQRAEGFHKEPTSTG